MFPMKSDNNGFLPLVNADVNPGKMTTMSESFSTHLVVSASQAPIVVRLINIQQFIHNS